MTPASRLRELLDGDELVVAPGAYDALTARMVQDAGFPAVYMTGAGTAPAPSGFASNGQPATPPEQPKAAAPRALPKLPATLPTVAPPGADAPEHGAPERTPAPEADQPTHQAMDEFDPNVFNRQMHPGRKK